MAGFAYLTGRLIRTPSASADRRRENSTLTFTEFFDAAKDLTVSHVWFGDFNSMYIELGGLKPAGNNLQGEVTVYAGYQWRMEGATACAAHEAGSEVLGASISSVQIISSSSELRVLFSNGLSLITGQAGEEPEWLITIRDVAHISVEGGEIHVQAAKSCLLIDAISKQQK